jgi:hypothetical protein
MKSWWSGKGTDFEALRIEVIMREKKKKEEMTARKDVPSL